MTTDILRAATEAFHASDAAWEAYMRASFGAGASEARYTARGMGTDGTTLRALYEARMATLRAWEAVKDKIDSDAYNGLLDTLARDADDPLGALPAI